MINNPSDSDTESEVSVGDVTRNLRYSSVEELNSSNGTESIGNVVLEICNGSGQVCHTENSEHSAHGEINSSVEAGQMLYGPLGESTSQYDITDNALEENINESPSEESIASSNTERVEYIVSNNGGSNSLNSFSSDHFEDFLYNSSDSDNDYEQLFGNDENVHELYSGFLCLKEMLSKDDCNESINANFKVNKAEMLFAILSFSKKYCLNNSATADLCKMINTFVDRKLLPETRYRIDKLFYPQESNRYFAVCPTCQHYVGAFNAIDRMKYCEVCEEYFDLKDPSYRDFFVTFDVESDIQHLIENNYEYYLSILDRLQDESTTKEDIYDGQCYKEFYSSLPMERKHCFATATFNSDGIRVFSSSKYSGWPIHLMINEVPIHVRNKKQIVYAMWFGHDKPNMTYFLKPFVEDINRLSNHGISIRVNNNIRNIHIYPICCVVDSVARAPMQGTTQFNGYYGCNWCLHPGKRILHHKGYTVKYPLLDDIPERRTVHETINQMEEAMNRGKSVCGVKKATPLINVESFNIIDGFVPDVMHCIDLGVAQQLTEYWFSSSGKPYSIPKRFKDSIDNQIKSFKVPTQVTRLSRSINDRNYWKVREWHNWLLFYSIPILSEVADFDPYVNHLSWLMESYCLLLQPSISEHDIQTADNLLKRFVAYAQYYYGEDAMTFNIHQLTHVAQSVVDWGPLWAHFGYPFESSNGTIVKNIHAAKGVLSQVCRSLSCNQSINILQKHISLMEYSAVTDFCIHLQIKQTIKSIKIEGIRYFGKPVKVHPVISLALNLPQNQAQAYSKMARDACIFKGSASITSRSDNSYAFLKSGMYIQIEQFVVNRLTNDQYVVYKKVNVETTNYESLQSLKKIASISPQINFEEVKNIQKLCVHLNVNDKQYISAVPNMYWY